MKSVASLVFLAALTWASPARAECDGCNANPYVPTAETRAEEIHQGQLAFGTRFFGVHLSGEHEAKCPGLGPVCAERQVPAQVHEQGFDVVELRLNGAYGLTDLLTLELQLPVRMVHETIAYKDEHGAEVTPDYREINHRNQTLTGPGDPYLLLHAGHTFGHVMVGGEAGVSLPLGRTNPNPYALARRGQAYESVQFGTGVASGLFGLDASVPVYKHTILRSYVHAQAVPSEDKFGYRAPTRVDGGIDVDIPLVAHLELAPLADVLYETQTRWLSDAGEDEASPAKLDVLLGVGVSYGMDEWKAALSLRTPVYAHAFTAVEEEGELEYPVLVQLSIQDSFEVIPTRAAHGELHEEGE